MESGPHGRARKVARMHRALIRLGPLAAIFAAQIGLMSAIAGRGTPAVAFPLAGSVVALLAVLAAYRGAFAELRGMGRRDGALAALAGILSVAVAPYLVAVNRASDAPPGTELIFFAGVLWGALAVLVAAASLARSGQTRRFAAVALGACAAVTGAAGVLASWERPSSFSPLVRYAGPEVWMLVAGTAFVAGGLLAARVARARGRAATMLAGALGAVAASAVLSLASADVLMLTASTWAGAPIVVWACAAAATWLVWTWLLCDGVARSSGAPVRALAIGGAALMAPPALMSLLIFVERWVGVAGPNPLIWEGVGGGALLLLAGAATIVAAASDRETGHGTPKWVIVCAGAALAVAFAGLAFSAIDASVIAIRDGATVRVAWTLAGWETIAGWVAVSCAGLALASVLTGDRVCAALALLTPASYAALAATPYHVLTRGLPSEIQVDFGTEYASIAFTAVRSWPALGALAGAVFVLVVVLSGRAAGPVDGAAHEPRDPEVRS